MGLRPPVVKRVAAVLAAAGLLGALMITPVDVSADGLVKQLAKGKISTDVIDTGHGLKNAPTISAGVLASVGAADIRAEGADADPILGPAGLGISGTSLGCRARNTKGDVRVNQDCTFRRQAEELIKINPKDPTNIIAGQNDSRVGFNHCGFDYSFDSGTTWGDGQPPFFQRLNSPETLGPTATNPNRNTIQGGQGTDHTYDAASDPALAFDSQGRAFYSCVVFDVNTNASGVLVTQSPVAADGSFAGGAFYDNVPSTGHTFVVVEDNAPLGTHEAVFHDKEFIAADFFTSSPNRDNVYVTWTVFEFNHKCGKPTPDNPAPFCSSPIFGSMSTNHGVTWSTPEEISGSSTALCSFGNFFDKSRAFNACDFNQGSDPQPQPDGSLAVVFFNQNTTTVNNQQLAVVCHPSGSSTSGTAHLNCGSPTKVGDDISAGEPQCDFGRGPEECVPGPFIRTNDFPRIGRDPGNGALYAVWQDYRNKEYDIQISRSVDGGHTWTAGASAVNPTTGFDHYFAAVDAGTGNLVATSYFQSQRVANENTTPTGGFSPGPGSDVGTRLSSYWLAGSAQAAPAIVTPFVATKVSPDFVPPDGNQAGFNGDYSGLAVTGTTAHPVWSDTRNAVPATTPSQGASHDEDIFSTSMAIPH